jgi:hypothetical protein
LLKPLEPLLKGHNILPTPKPVPGKGLAWICFSDGSFLKSEKRKVYSRYSRPPDRSFLLDPTTPNWRGQNVKRQKASKEVG